MGYFSKKRWEKVPAPPPQFNWVECGRGTPVVARPQTGPLHPPAAHEASGLHPAGAAVVVGESRRAAQGEGQLGPEGRRRRRRGPDGRPAVTRCRRAVVGQRLAVGVGVGRADARRVAAIRRRAPRLRVHFPEAQRGRRLAVQPGRRRRLQALPHRPPAMDGMRVRIRRRVEVYYCILRRRRVLPQNGKGTKSHSLPGGNIQLGVALPPPLSIPTAQLCRRAVLSSSNTLLRRSGRRWRLAAGPVSRHLQSRDAPPSTRFSVKTLGAKNAPVPLPRHETRQRAVARSLFATVRIVDLIGASKRARPAFAPSRLLPPSNPLERSGQSVHWQPPPPPKMAIHFTKSPG